MKPRESGQWIYACQKCGEKLPEPVYRKDFTPWVKCPRNTGCKERRKKAEK